MNTESSSWPLGRPDTRPAPGRIHVWCADRRRPGPVHDGLIACLSPDEALRAGRLERDEDRRRFTVGRTVLRDLLGAYLGIAPREVELSAATGRKPALRAAGATAPLFFNAAHAEHFSIYAFAADREVGVDIEPLAEVPESEAVARSEFAREETEAIRALDPARRSLAFALAWTRKEAVLKATGEGLSRPLDSFAVTCDPDGPVRVLRAPPGAGPAEAWSLHSLTPGPGFVAAVAWRGEGSLACFRWSPR